jgi:hypothetical protein
MSNNLRRFQYQIGNVVLGPGTQYEVLGMSIAAYNVTNQDSQVQLSDEVTMAQDTFQAQSITLTIGVKDNAPTQFATSLPEDLVTKASKLLGVLQDEWKANEVKQLWGTYKPLIYCDGYGLVKQIYGRPRKFQYMPKTQTSQYRKVTAEYARLDTLCYADIESKTAPLVNNAAPVLYTTAGDANSWFRILLQGPQSNPTITVGEVEVQLQTDILAGVQVEVSGYAWQRRIIDSNSINLRTTMFGNTLYLDQLLIAKNTATPISWSATNTSGASGCLVLWRDAFNVI